MLRGHTQRFQRDFGHLAGARPEAGIPKCHADIMKDQGLRLTDAAGGDTDPQVGRTISRVLLRNC